MNQPAHATPGPSRALRRSSTDKWFGGVCGGLAERFGISSGLLRLLFVLSVVLPGPQVLLYLVLWIVIPRR
ncbi:PspC domain-containing protein [Williamsia sp. SKLECPSW1]